MLVALRPPPVRPGPALTRRESEVLALAVEGLSDAEVAERLVLGTETVRTHGAALLRKLGALDRTQAVVPAYEAGPVDLGRAR